MRRLSKTRSHELGNDLLAASWPVLWHLAPGWTTFWRVAKVEILQLISRAIAAGLIFRQALLGQHVSPVRVIGSFSMPLNP